jgi:anaerobic selenocysteine-containing dehydrogenase
VRGFDTPSRKLEFWSPTLAEWGWPEVAIPGYIRSHVHPDRVDRAAGERVLISTFRLPTLIHTRSGNAKWLYEISHRNPLWVHPEDATEMGVDTDDLVRVTTDIGYFVTRCWVTEGIRPGVLACSHHMGRWRLQDDGGSKMSSSLVDLDQSGSEWQMRVRRGASAFESSDPDTSRIWWTDVGVHQNLTFPVHPDPISGMHCWHQKVRLSRAEPGDRHGDVHVDTARSREHFRAWLDLTRGADEVSPDGMRRPHWMLRPFRPTKEAYRLPTVGDPDDGARTAADD